MPMLFLVRYCDILAQNPAMAEEKLSRVAGAIRLWRQVEESGAALTLKELDISGRDLMALGVPPGPQLGEYLQGALEWVLEFPDNNHREMLIEFVKENAVNTKKTDK